jgi:hypothetical protein
MPRRNQDIRSFLPQPRLVSGESEDERIERTEFERHRQIDSLLAELPISSVERQFVINTAEKLVDLACDEYVRVRTAIDLHPQCISAAATVAMMIVYDG